MTKVLYFHDNRNSLPVQHLLAADLGRLFSEENLRVMAFGGFLRTFRKYDNIPEEEYQRCYSPDPVKMLLEIRVEWACKISNEARDELRQRLQTLELYTVTDLLQATHWHAIQQGDLELWGLEDPALARYYAKRLHLDLRALPVEQRSRKMKEFQDQRCTAVAENILSLLAAKSLSLLPVVMPYTDYPVLSAKLRDRNIDVISCDTPSTGYLKASCNTSREFEI